MVDIKKVKKVSRQQIEKAEIEINSYLHSTFTIPFVSGSVPLLIGLIAANYTARLILKIELSKGNKSVSDWETQLKEESIDKLMKLAKGELTLLDSSGDVIARNSVIKLSTSGQQPVFGMGVDGEFESNREDWPFAPEEND